MIFFVESNDDIPPCPYCHGTLKYRDLKKRILRKEGGDVQWLAIRRFRCKNCHHHHNELPDCLAPYKHYEAEVISGVLDSVITPDDIDSENYPSSMTMLRWLAWFNSNLANIEGYLKRIQYQIYHYNEKILDEIVASSLLESIRNTSAVWLETILRVIYNSGGFLTAVWC